ncbi:MAG TPA: hypothetical protein VER79_05235, partial [Candidatus Limnocylindrales bacterium]|nr:hypothetical protein [Candidatus Limnocylindrales bacterium]
MWWRITQVSIVLLILLGAAGVLSQAEAQASIELAATVSATGLRFVDGVRYTVTALPPPGATIQGLVAEITLPAGAELVEAFDSDQLMFRGARAGASGESLIWTIETLEPNQPLGPFAFTLREPVTGPLSVFMQWATTDPNLIGVISTFAVPELREAANDIDSLMVSTAGTGDLTPVGATGVLLHVAAGVVSEDTPVLVGEMPTDLNPPPEYGAIWWCSGLAMAGLPEGAQADVLVPLRRPLPPLTTTTLFALQPDNTWLPLEQRGVISFDGQYVAYTHPGGVIATGVDGDLQPAEQPPFDVPPAEAPPPAPPPAEPPPPMEPPPPPPAQEAVIPVNPPPVEPPPTAAAVPTVESVPAEAPPTGVPLEAPINVPPTLTAPLADITGGSEQVGRPPIPTPAFTRELIQIVPTPPPVALENITDGTSNTILFGEATGTPDQVALPTVALGGITAGTSNTILLGEATGTPDQVALPTATLGGITDGTSNTILLGEATGTPDQVSPPTATLGGITDSSSNTILLGEATRSPGDGGVRPVNLTPTPLPDQVTPPTAALGG